MTTTVNTRRARRAADHICLDLNVADGVDSCVLYEYCIDTISVPSQCIVMNSTFVGREFATENCLTVNTANAEFCVSGFFCRDIVGNYICRALDYTKTFYGRKTGIYGDCRSDVQANAVLCSLGPVCLSASSGNTCKDLSNTVSDNRAGT